MFPIGDKNPTSTFPLITIVLIGLNIAVFVWQFSLGPAGFEAAIYAYGFVPGNLFSPAGSPIDSAVPAPATVLTSMFMHGGLMHIAGNMLFLWIFGDNVDDAMGAIRFVIFYVLCGIAAAFGQAFADTSSVIPMIGASGAVSGILGAYLMLHPRAPVRVIVPLGIMLAPMLVPAFMMLGLWFVFQLLSDLMADPGQGGVAFRAHVAGFIAGCILVVPFKRAGVRLFE